MKQKIVDMERFMEMYMNGYNDYNMSGEFGCSISHIHAIRDIEGLPSNQGLFTWQNKLSKTLRDEIPDKYKYSHKKHML
jgi:hypothetical protein